MTVAKQSRVRSGEAAGTMKDYLNLKASARLIPGLRRISSYPAAILVLAFALTAGPAGEPANAVEKFVTTAGLIKNAPHIAHVRVLGSRTAPGMAALEYELEVLEVLKGKLPGQIHMRLFSGFQVVNPGGAVHPAGSEWLVFLGPGQQGVYPIRSLQWGRIDVATHADSGEQYLIKKLSGFPPPAKGNYHSLTEFRAIAKKLLGR